jgi:hypothetical protein
MSLTETEFRHEYWPVLFQESPEPLPYATASFLLSAPAVKSENDPLKMSVTTSFSEGSSGVCFRQTYTDSVIKRIVSSMINFVFYKIFVAYRDQHFIP